MSGSFVFRSGVGTQILIVSTSCRTSKSVVALNLDQESKAIVVRLMEER